VPLVNVIHHVMTAHTSYRHTAGVGHYNVLVRTCDFTRFKSFQISVNLSQCIELNKTVPVYSDAYIHFKCQKLFTK